MTLWAASAVARTGRIGLLLAAAAIFAGPPACAADISENDVKLALLYKIARFVEWPDRSHADFRLCIAGEQTYEAARERLTTRRIDERQIRPVLLGRSVAAESCDALYIARSDKERIEDLTATFRYSPVLTVSDAPDFALDGGVIELSTRDNRVQISINVSASKRAGLEISSQLLELAKIVDDRRAEL